MNIIKAVKTANKIQKVKVKAKKTLAVATKVVFGAAVLGLGALALRHNSKVKKRDAKIKKDIEDKIIIDADTAALTKIEYKKKKKIAKLELKKTEDHGVDVQSNIRAESVNI